MMQQLCLGDPVRRDSEEDRIAERNGRGISAHDAERERKSRSPAGIAGSTAGVAEPRIRYARAFDDVSIAYWTLGQGAPLVYLAGAPWSHVELWQLPECRRWYEHLASQRMLVRYDQRGTGLSERDISDYSLEALLLDVEAVVDRLGVERF